MNALEIVTLKKKIAPLLIPIFFWLIVLCSLISGIKLIGTGGPILGILVILGVPGLARIILEVMLSVLEINSQLKAPK